MLLRAIPPLRAAFLLTLLQVCCLSGSVNISAEGSHVPLNCRVTQSCHLNAGDHRVRNRLRPCSSRDNDSVPVLISFLRFRHVISGSLAFISRVTHLTRFLPGLFLLCSRRWFFLTNAAEGDLKPAPVSRFRGAFPSSVVQLRTAQAHRLVLRSWRTIIRIADQSCLGPAGRSLPSVEYLVEPVKVEVG